MPPPHIAALVGSPRMPASMRQRLEAVRERRARSTLQHGFSDEWLEAHGCRTPEEKLALALRYEPTCPCGEDWWTEPQPGLSLPEPGGNASGSAKT